MPLKDLCVERFSSPIYVNVEVSPEGEVVPLPSGYCGFDSLHTAKKRRLEYLATMPVGRVFKRTAFKTVKVEFFKVK